MFRDVKTSVNFQVELIPSWWNNQRSLHLCLISHEVSSNWRITGLNVMTLNHRGSVAQWIARWTSSSPLKKWFKGCGFESHQSHRLLSLAAALWSIDGGLTLQCEDATSVCVYIKNCPCQKLFVLPIDAQLSFTFAKQMTVQLIDKNWTAHQSLNY